MTRDEGKNAGDAKLIFPWLLINGFWLDETSGTLIEMGKNLGWSFHFYGRRKNTTS